MRNMDQEILDLLDAANIPAFNDKTKLTNFDRIKKGLKRLIISLEVQQCRLCGKGIKVTKCNHCGAAV